jgi:hypothetical protein
MVVNSLLGPRVVNPSRDLDEEALTTIADKSGGRYFRAPTLAELFGDRGYMVGNEALRPERGTSVDGGLLLDLRRGRAALHAHAAGFAVWSDQLIQWQQSGPRLRPVNLDAARVLARAFSGAPMGAATVQRLADSLVPPGAAWAHNQSMLDLGAVVCTARAPRCDECPLAADCAWRAAGGGEGGHAVPDPARTTAGTSRPQARFDGSDRQGRGRILAALRVGASVALAELDTVTHWGDAERSRRVADALVVDGLAVWDGEQLRAAR